MGETQVAVDQFAKKSKTGDASISDGGKVNIELVEVEVQPRRHDWQWKKETWHVLDRIRGASMLPWIVGGDLNAVLSHNEKSDGCRRSYIEMEDFRNALT
ncbi:hypothetical protein V6N13_114254 [Hibiscus sabdariffa]